MPRRLWWLRSGPILAILLLGGSFLRAEESFALVDGDRVVFLGDSITQGGQYVVDVEAYLMTRFPDRAIEVVNHGLSSETVAGTSEPGHDPRRPWVMDRFERDGLAYRPTVLVLCYGMNDGSYAPPEEANQRSFRDGMTAAIAWAWSGGADVTLLTPPPYDAYRRKATDPTPAHYGYRFPAVDYDRTLVAYAAWEVGLTGQDRTGPLADAPRPAADGARPEASGPPPSDARNSAAAPPASAAARPDLIVADLHTFVNDVLAARRVGDVNFTFAEDGVHPGPTGHLLMAQGVLTGWHAPAEVDVATLDVAAATGTSARGAIADVTVAGHGITFTWTMPLSFPLPDGVDARTVELAQTQARLNRTLLTVTGLAEGRWALRREGGVVAEHDAAEWAAGVDLTAERPLPTMTAAKEFRAALVKARADDYAAWRKLMAAKFTMADVPAAIEAARAEHADREAELRRLAGPRDVRLTLVRVGP